MITEGAAMPVLARCAIRCALLVFLIVPPLEIFQRA
jgi:hypothetical protein